MTNPHLNALEELSGKIAEDKKTLAEDKKTLQSRAAALAMRPGANIGAIARAAGVSRQTLYNWISAQQK